MTHTAGASFRNISIDALVLARKHSGEADRFVTFFTREYGIVRAIAKGVRKIPSARGGHLEPFGLVRVLLSHGNTGTYVGSVDTIFSPNRLMQHEEAYMRAQTMAATVVQLFEEFDPHAQLYDIVQEAWKILPDIPVEKQLLLESTFVGLALKQAGMLPDLHQCRVCGVHAPEGDVTLLSGADGFCCVQCRSDRAQAAHALSPRLLRAMRFIIQQPDQALRLVVTQDEGSRIASSLQRLLPSLSYKAVLV